MSLQNTSYIMHPPSNIHALQAAGGQARRHTLSQSPHDIHVYEVCYCKLHPAEFT